MAVAEFFLHVCSSQFKIPVLNNDGLSTVFFCYTRCASKQLIVPFWTKLFWSGNGELIQFDLNAMKTGFLMVSNVLNGTGHPTVSEFSPLAAISSSFLDELSFCALAVLSIFALWMFCLLCCVGCLCTCALLLYSAQCATAAHRWLAACLLLSELILKMLPGFRIPLQSTIIQ